MDQRRFLVFFTVSMLIWIGWIHFLVPWLLPPPPKVPKPAETQVSVDEPADALFPLNGVEATADLKPAAEVPRFPAKTLWIGPETDANAEELAKYFLAAKVNSRGASVDLIQLTDVVHYPAFNRRGERLNLTAGSASGRRTFELQVPLIDKQMEDQPLDRIPWEVARESEDSVTFRIKSPDGAWEVLKQITLRKLTPDEQKKPYIRDSLVAGYEVKLRVTLKNLTDRSKEINYILQGPTGVPLEDRDNTYKYRDVRMGFLRDDGVTVDDSKMSANDVVKKEKANAAVIWNRPIKYIGVDVAYFAALLRPVEDQIKERTIESTKAVVVSGDREHPQYSDISVEVTSKSLTVPAHDEVSHDYMLYAGPKRKQLLQEISAGAVMDYGWFDSICRGMVWVLNSFHSAGLSYGLAIICLTIAVRCLLIPLSRHQAVHAAKMKELQPKIMARQKELEARHGKNTEEYMKASQELVAEQSKMMLGGCLPMFLQLPIFIALYRSLSSSIELRMEPFLWFENLASPDALFPLPFAVPFLGWTEFNLLPCISIGLMMVQQKLTMPPAQNEEQAAQYKMMNIMMFVMGATFYRVPAGLCLYFICTNIWSMTERWFFERQAKLAKLNPPPTPDVAQNKPAEPKKPSKLGELWRQLQEAADKDTSIRRQDRNGSDGKGASPGRESDDGKGGKKRGKK